jgi:hypothetical protein
MGQHRAANVCNNGPAINWQRRNRVPDRPDTGRASVFKAVAVNKIVRK